MLPSDTLSSNWRRCRKSDAFGEVKVTSGGDHHLSGDIHRSWRSRLIGSDVMRLLQHIASMLLLIGLLCPAAQAADQPDPLADEIARWAAAKWRAVLARIDSEQETLAACRASPDACSPAARRLLQLVELGRRREGRARLGEINRAVNLSIRATSDWSQYGVDDFWSPPLATLEKGAGDCEDYAILKYLALREAGISPDDLRLLIVSHPRRRTMHAVLAVRWDEEWLLLDNLTMVMVNSLEATQYLPLIALDYQATTTFAAGSPAPQEAPAAIQNTKDLPSRSVAR